MKTFNNEDATIKDQIKNKTRLTKSISVRNRLRDVLAVASLIGLLIILFDVIQMYRLWAPRMHTLPNKPFNELTQSAMDIRIELSRSLFQISVIFIGGIWGLLIAKKGEAVLVFADRPELVMSILATTLLCLSCACHFYYLDVVTDIYADAGWVASKMAKEGIADIFEPGINYLFLTQRASVAAGIVISILTFISAHKLK